MASYTPNYNLKKPADSDYYDIADDNGNMDKIDTALNTLNAKIGNCKIINQKYYGSETTLATVLNDIDSAIAPYAENGVPKFMQFGYMSGIAGRSIGLVDGCFINVYFNSAALVLVEFIGMTLNEVNYIKKVTNWGSSIESSLNSKINSNTSNIQNISLDLSAKTVYTGDVFSAPAGAYRVSGTAANLPVNANGYLNVTYRASDTKFLEYITDGGRFFTNTLNGVNWTGWNEIVKSSDINIGTNINISSTATVSGTFKTLATITGVSLGNYLLIVDMSFAAGTGNRILLVDTSETDSNNPVNSVLAEGRATLQKIRPFRLNTTDTIYIRAYQNSGSDMNVNGNYRLVKISG